MCKSIRHAFSEILLNAFLSEIKVRPIIDGHSIISELSQSQFENACLNSVLTQHSHVFVKEWVQYFFQLLLRSEPIVTIFCKHVLGWDVE